MTLFEELKRRGLIAQLTDEEEIKELINNGKATFYIGFDPTADSLHVGHFMALCLMKRLQMAGNKPIALLGGGTGMIGDPSGKTDMRKMMTTETINHNVECFKKQMSRFIDFSDNKALVVNNADWLMNLNYIDVLREVGAHFSVNKMLTFECYKQRMERGLTFLEFNYMIMQSYDFYKLYKDYGCNMQFGGDDQWANMLGGTELIRKKLGKDAYAMTITLLLNSEGKKMGKTEKGAVWLDPEKTSPYDFYQYWRNVDDKDVEKCLGLLTFLPMVALLFVCLAVLEDSGYMARAAFVMDRVLRRFGLSGKAFIPMLMGFGCTVPAVLAARTMESEKDRRMTILLTPFMSCGARLPIYALMTAAFFPDRAALAVFALYLLGPAAAVVSGLILKRAVFQGDPAPFLLELPPYRMPTARSVGRRVGQRVGDFLTRAGTLIAAMSTVLWCLQHISTDLRLEDAARSMLAWLGSAVAPVFAPMGFGLWQAAVALLAGLAAKEAVVSTLALLCAFSPLDAVQAGATLSGLFSPAAAAAFLAFSALYTPCVAAIAAIHREMEGLSWTLLALVWQLGAPMM